jgi:hypothetical protein
VLRVLANFGIGPLADSGGKLNSHALPRQEKGKLLRNHALASVPIPKFAS